MSRIYFFHFCYVASLWDHWIFLESEFNSIVWCFNHSNLFSYWLCKSFVLSFQLCVSTLWFTLSIVVEISSSSLWGFLNEQPFHEVSICSTIQKGEKPTVIIAIPPNHPFQGSQLPSLGQQDLFSGWFLLPSQCLSVQFFSAVVTIISSHIPLSFLCFCSLWNFTKSFK